MTSSSFYSKCSSLDNIADEGVTSTAVPSSITSEHVSKVSKGNEQARIVHGHHPLSSTKYQQGRQHNGSFESKIHSSDAQSVKGKNNLISVSPDKL